MEEMAFYEGRPRERIGSLGLWHRAQIQREHDPDEAISVQEMREKKV